MEKAKTKRIMITLTAENVKRLEHVNDTLGISKSTQIQVLVNKYLEKEYGGKEDVILK